MAVTINIYYKGKRGSARAFANEMLSEGLVDKIRAEKGNLKYEYFIPFDDEETVLLIDKWESQTALDIHHASPMMNRISELRNKYDLTMTVERFVDDTNAPKSDEKFIRK